MWRMQARLYMAQSDPHLCAFLLCLLLLSRWSERKSDTSGQIVPFTHTTSANKDNIYIKSLNLASGSSSVPSLASNSSQKGLDGGAFVDTDVGQMCHLRARISDIFQDLKRLLEEKETFVCGPDGQAITRDAEGGAAHAQHPRDVAGGWRVVSLVTQFDEKNRPLMPPSDSYDEDVSILYRNTKHDTVIVKLTCIVPYRMEEVAPYLADVRAAPQPGHS